MRYYHPETGQKLEASEEDYEGTFKAEGYLPGDPPPPEDEASKLAGMTRDELNAHAAFVGVTDAEALPNKAAVIEAIEGAQPSESPELPETAEE